MNQRLWTHEVTTRPNPLALLQVLLPRFFKVRKYFNLLDDRLVNERLREGFGDATFEQTVIPLYINATEYQTGKQIILSQGSIYEAVRATIALPLVFPPFEHSQGLLSDGYLSEPLPIGIAIQEGATIILAVGFESISQSKSQNLSEYILHLSSILSNNLLEATLAFYQQAYHAELIPIIPHFESEIGMFDTHRVPEIIQIGEIEGEKLLPALRKRMESP
jgi:NTE family protein